MLFYNKQRKEARHQWYLQKNQAKMIAENRNLRLQIAKQEDKWHKLQHEYPSLKSVKLFASKSKPVSKDVERFRPGVH
jgi:hypothetical protein